MTDRHRPTPSEESEAVTSGGTPDKLVRRLFVNTGHGRD